MKKQRRFLVCLLLLSLFATCKKEKSFERGQDGSIEIKTGDVIFAATGSCTPQANVQVLVTDLNGKLIMTVDPEISSVDPDCLNPSFKKVAVPAGKCNIIFICNGDSVQTEATITAGVCQAFSIDYWHSEPTPLDGDWFPLKNRWTYNDASNAADTLAITSSGTEIIDHKTYTIFKNNATGEIRYYRKDGSKYYEYVTYFKDAPLTEPVELLFLQDDVPTGTSWLSDAGHPILRGFAVDAKIRNTVVAKGQKRSFNGRTYYNLIEVETEFMVRSENGEYRSEGKLINTIYAKGIGVVYYVDEIFDKFRKVLNYDVVP